MHKINKCIFKYTNYYLLAWLNFVYWLKLLKKEWVGALKKTTKLVVSLCMVALSLVVLCFGVWAATSVSYTVSGMVSYDINNVDLRFSIDASIAGASSNPDSDVAVSNSTFRYDNSGNLNLFLDDWNIGEIYFKKTYQNNGTVVVVPDIVITVTITNLSSIQPMYVKNTWQTDDAGQFDTEAAPNDNANIRLKFEKSVGSTGEYINSNLGEYTELLTKNSSVTYRLTFSLKQNRDSIEPIGFVWGYVFDAFMQ